MRKTTDLLKKLFYFALAAFPIALSIYLSLNLFVTSALSQHKGTDLKYGYQGFHWALLCSVAVLAVVAVIALLYKKQILKKIFVEKNKTKLAIAVLVLAVVVRLVLYFVFESILIPFSDGAHAWNAANGLSEEHLHFKSLQNGWNNFTGIIAFAVNTFGIKYPVAIFIQFMLDALIAFALYKLAFAIFKSCDIAFFSGIFYALNPSILMRMFYFSPDIFGQLCLVTATYFFVKMLEKQTTKDVMIYALITGVAAGIGNSYKSISIVFIVAAVIVVVFKLAREKFSRHQIITLLLSLIVIAVPAMGINKGVLAFSSQQLGVECKDLNTWHFVNVGLNPRGEGQVGDSGAYYYTFRVAYNGIEPDIAREMLIEYLKTGWEESDTEVLPWLFEKIKWTWQDDTQAFSKLMLNSISSEMNTLQHYAYMLLWNFASSGCQAFYILTLILALTGIGFVVKKYRDNDGIFFGSLYVFGFSLLLLIIECQSRYKLNIIHYIGILAAVGLCEILKTISDKPEVKKEAVESAEIV